MKFGQNFDFFFFGKIQFQVHINTTMADEIALFIPKKIKFCHKFGQILANFGKFCRKFDQIFSNSVKFGRKFVKF